MHWKLEGDELKKWKASLPKKSCVKCAWFDDCGNSPIAMESPVIDPDDVREGSLPFIVTACQHMGVCKLTHWFQSAYGTCGAFEEIEP